MSNSDDRGWNIVGGSARPSWLAKLLGASRDGEVSYLAMASWALLGAVAAKAAGLW